jgi:hypothetical protein
MNILIDQNLNVEVVFNHKNDSFLNQKVATTEYDMGYVEGDMGGGMYGEVTSPKDPLLSSWPFVIGISSITLILSVGLGILLAKRKIKKGFELYED